MFAVTMTTPCKQIINVFGAEEESSRNVLFSWGTGESITIEAGSLCMNGDISTDGVCVINAGNSNLNGSVNENLSDTVKYYHDAIEQTFFWNDDTIYYSDDFDNNSCNEIFTVPTVVRRSCMIEKNTAIENTAVKSSADFTVDAGTFNMNNSVLYSVTGDIVIETDNFSSDGLIYAPLGTVVINSGNVNIKGQIIAKNIEINADYSVSLNYNDNITVLFDGFSNTITQPEEDDDDIVDIGEIYWKDPEPDDYEWNDYVGCYAVKNQFLISCDEDVYFDDIAAVADEFDAQIVGYIALTNDYQLEFNEDISFDEINGIIELLSEIPNVRRVSFNIGVENSEEFCTDDTQWSSSWNEDSPDGSDWGVESIKLCSALAEIGVIPDTSATYTDVDTSHLFNVKIGLIDGAFDEWHEDLEFVSGGVWNNFATETDLVNAITSDEDYSHGTHVAGTMGAECGNGHGITGIAVKSRLYGFACDVDNSVAADIDSSSSYTDIYHSFGMKAALSLLIGNNVKVINHSRGNGNLAFYAAQGNADAQKAQKETADQYKDLLSKLIDKGYNFNICTSAGNSNNWTYYEDPDSTYGYIRVSVYNRNPTAHPNADTSNTYSGLDEGYTTDARYDDAFQFIDNPKVESIILSVGAMDVTGSVTDYTCRGDRVDLMAPGDNIYSCTHSATNTTNNYGYKGGTSMASPHVAGSIGLAYSVNTAISGSLMKDLVISSCDSSTDYPILNTYELMRQVNLYLEAYNIIGDNTSNDEYAGIATGIVVDESGTVLKDVTVSVSRIKSTDATATEVIEDVITDNEGRYEVVLNPGDYVLLISKEGYISETVYCTIEAETTKFIDTVTLYDEGKYGSQKYTINGTVKNALNGNAISGVDIFFRKGWNNTNVNLILDALATRTTSDDLGKFTAKMKVGTYTAVLQKDGFITAYVNMVVTPNSTEQYASMTPVLDNNVYRIVLTWGDTPNDLDSYLIGSVSSTPFTVYYSNKEFKSGTNSVMLDVDDTTMYGPETITVNWSDDFGTCQYIVKDYTNRSNPSSNILSYSGARVTVYKGNKHLADYAVPAGKIGREWHVFDIVDGELVPVNTIS